MIKLSRYIHPKFQLLKEDQKKSILKFRQLSKLADKVNC